MVVELNRVLCFIISLSLLTALLIAVALVAASVGA